MKMLIIAMMGLSIMLVAITTVMAATNLEKATFAGGCFWCMEHPFDEIPGVVSVTSGYTGGLKKNPTYEEVSAGGTGHAESVQVVYDPARVTYEKLLSVFWHNIDPTAKDRQFCDSGHQYRSAIFYHNEEQRRLGAAVEGTIGKEQNLQRTCRNRDCAGLLSSTLPRITTNTITRRTRSVTNTTVTDAVVTSDLRNCGAVRRGIEVNDREGDASIAIL